MYGLHSEGRKLRKKDKHKVDFATEKQMINDVMKFYMERNGIGTPKAFSNLVKIFIREGINNGYFTAEELTFSLNLNLEQYLSMAEYQEETEEIFAGL